MSDDLHTGAEGDGEPDRPMSAAEALRRGRPRDGLQETGTPPPPAPAAGEDLPGVPVSEPDAAPAAREPDVAPPVAEEPPTEAVSAGDGEPAEATDPGEGEATPTEPTEPTEPAEAVPAPPAGAAVRPSRLGSVIVGLAAAVLVLALAAALLAVRASERQAVDDAREAAVAAARTGVAKVLTASYRTFDGDVAEARKGLTPQFRKNYDQLVERSFRQLVTENRAVISAQVQAVGVKQAGRDRVVVLLFVNQVSTNSKRPVPQLDQPRVRVTMLRQDGRWLIDKMDAI